MKIKNIILGFFAFIFLAIPCFVFAETAPAWVGDTKDPFGLNTTANTAYGPDITKKANLYSIIGNVINIFLGLLGVIFMILTIYAGILWMTAHGETKQVQKAKDILQSAVIGLIIVTLAYSISIFVITTLTQALTTP